MVKRLEEMRNRRRERFAKGSREILEGGSRVERGPYQGPESDKIT